MALALHLARAGRARHATAALGATIALGLAFLAIHGHEYAGDIAAGALPGRLYHAGVALPGAGLFYTLYYFMTGLHSLHVVFGVAAARLARPPHRSRRFRARDGTRRSSSAGSTGTSSIWSGSSSIRCST